MIHIFGRGVVGRRLETLLTTPDVLSHSGRFDGAGHDGDIAILAHGGYQAAQAVALLERGLHVITMGDQPSDMGDLLDRAQHIDVERTLVVGAATSPGLSGLLARHQAAAFGEVDEISVALHGTAGPACAHTYHSSLSGKSENLIDGEFVTELAGSGRRLCWFPEPIGGRDCYLARSTEPQLLHTVFPITQRISYRRSARRRDRLTARLPMMSPPPPEGAVGGLWVEVRGADTTGARLTTVTGVAELIASSSAAVAASFAAHIVGGQLAPGLWLPGDARLPTNSLLRGIVDRGIRLQRFTGVPTVS